MTGTEIISVPVVQKMICHYKTEKKSNFWERRRKYGIKKNARNDKFVPGECLIDWFCAGSILISDGGANATE